MRLNRKSGGNIAMKQIIEWKNAFHTSSIIYRKSIFSSGYPAPINGAGDVGLALRLRAYGKIYYINKPMSVYRSGVEGSWTIRNKDGQKAHLTRIEFLKLFNIESNHRYNRLINKQIDKLMVEIDYNNNEISKLHDMGYFRIIRAGHTDVAIAVFLQRHNYKIYSFISECLRRKNNR